MKLWSLGTVHYQAGYAVTKTACGRPAGVALFTTEEKDATCKVCRRACGARRAELRKRFQKKAR